MILKKIISGGQTGADIAGLEAAREFGIKTGGFAPKGYKTEEGPDYDLKNFAVRETASDYYGVRTKKNIETSDGTVIFTSQNTKKKRKGSGTVLTYQTALQKEKPVIINPTPLKLVNWIEKNKIEVLNVAGDRASQNPEIYSLTKKILEEVFGILNNRKK